jgi:hypothetical protein
MSFCFTTKRLGAMTSAIVVLTCCGGSTRPTPTAPSGGNESMTTGSPGVPSTLIGPKYTISGAVTEYRGGLVAGASVGAYDSCNASTQTDGHGQYVIACQYPTVVGVWKAGYERAWKKNVSTDNPTFDFVLHRSITLTAFGTALAETIRGDEFVAGDDVLFGGLCAHTPCKVMEFADFTGKPRQVTIQLRWNDPTHQLALYKYEGDPDSIPSDQRAVRYCCSSELLVRVYVSGYFDAIAVGFEDAGGKSPDPADSQQFELTVRPEQ